MTLPPSSACSGEPAPASPLVLIVDDNERNRKLAGDVLGAAGLRTIDAGSGRQGIKLASERQPDVILLDLRLPDMDGTDVARSLRTDARTASIPIVALSAVRNAGESASLTAGFAGFLEKPIDVRAFPEQVRSYCRRVGG
jgi:two-component system cell cycle response regulator DivK